MKTQKTYNLTTINSGFIGFLLLLIVAVGCQSTGRTTQTNPQSSFDNQQTNTANRTTTPKDATEIIGKVVGVSDGDTITVLDADKKQHKIRLQGIDAPESGQPFGQASKQNLSALVFGKTVKVLLYKKDRYGREVGTIYVNGKDVNLEQVKAGLAWHYKKYANEQSESEREEYATAETTARTSKNGLWNEVDTISPEEWRAGKRSNIKESRSSGTPETKVTEPETRTTTTDTKGLIVYVTRTGEKYHRAGCRHLRRSQIPISLADAKASYDACSVCNPPR